MPLKPNYGRKEINPNYKIGCGFGNAYFDMKKSRGIIELLLNGFTVRFIPHIGSPAFSFPPQREKLEYIHELEREFNSMAEHRYWAFYYAEVVFYEMNEKAGQYMVADFRNPDNNSGNECLIFFVDSNTFQKLSRQMRREMPWIVSKRQLRHHVRKADIADLFFVQYVDEKLRTHRDLLTENMRIHLGL